MPLSGQPPEYTRGYSFTQHSIDQPNVPQPGDKLDQEFDDIATAINATNGALQGILNPDGTLKDGIVDEANFVPGLFDQVAAGIEQDLQDLVNQAQTAQGAAATSAGQAQAQAASAATSAANAQSAATSAAGTASAAIAARDVALNAAASADTSADLAGNSASTASNAMQQSQDAKDLSFKWAEYLAGPVAPAPPGWPESVDDGMWSAKWWAVRAREIVGSWGGLYLGAHPSAPTPPPEGFPPGTLYFDTTIGQILLWDGANWVPMTQPVPGLVATFVYRATNNQTVFSGVDLNGRTLAFNQAAPENVEVKVNGADLILTAGPDGDFTVNVAGNAITILQPLKAGSIVKVNLLMSPLSSAPVAANVVKVWDIDNDPDTMAPGQIDGVKTTFALFYTSPVDGTRKPVNGASSAQLAFHLDGVPQEPGADFTYAAGSVTWDKPPPRGTDFWGSWMASSALA